MNAVCRGVDVSLYNVPVDFARVKKAGYAYAIIRAGYRGYVNGAFKKDDQWEAITSNAIANNMPYGVYFFSQAVNEKEAREEAQYTLNLVKNLAVQPLYPIYIDTEWSNNKHTGRADRLTRAQRTAVVKAFCDEIEKNGYYAGIYASTSWFKDMLIDSELKAYDKWVAQYASKCTYNGAYGMWQYGGGTNKLNNVKVDGVASAACDQNMCYKDYPTIIKNAGLNGYKKPTAAPVQPAPTPAPTPAPVDAKTFTVTAPKNIIDRFVQVAEWSDIKDYEVH